MTDLKFSVSMCVYYKDNPVWFREAIESVMNQSRVPDEIVLVADGPLTAELDLVISDYEKLPYFKIIRFYENRGHGEARRAGMNACSNSLIALMDADDISTYDRFEKQLKVFENDSSIDIVGGIITEFINNKENIIGVRNVPEYDEEIKEYMKKRCPFNQVTVMFKKQSVDLAGGYVEWFWEEDYYLWLRMALLNMKFYNLQSVLVNVRCGNEMYQRRGGLKYFKSEAELQRFMLDKKIIGYDVYFMNVLKRFIVQVVLPNKIRGLVFKMFAREKVNG